MKTKGFIKISEYLLIVSVVFFCFGIKSQALTLSKNAIEMGQGEKYILTADEGCSYVSSDEKIASVSEKGKITANSKGSAAIIAENDKGEKSECKVTVLSAPEKVSLNKKKITMGVGESFNFDASLPEGTASYRKVYSCSDETVLQYSKSGIFKALKKGTVTVTVTTFNGKTAECKVTVLPAAKKVSLNKTEITMGVGDSFNFNSSVPEGSASYMRKYSAKKKSVLKYTKSGIFKALKKGTTTVTVTTFNGKKATCKVTVLPQPKKIYAAKSTYTLSVGSTKKAAVKFPKGTYCNKFTYKSSDESVAYCDSKGKIHAKKIGTATITAKSRNGKKCTFTVIVRAMNVPFVNQFPLYPTGCEAASGTQLLKYYGYDITLDDMIEAIPRKNIRKKNGKRYGPDINKYFVGDPKGEYTSKNPGYGAFAPCVTKALQKAIDKRDGKHKAVNISGCSFKTLLNHISQGRPAIVWATYNMIVPQTVNSWYINGTGEYFEYPRGTHVMVLTGYSKNTVTVMDPIGGSKTFNLKTFQKRWKLLGKQAIILK